MRASVAASIAVLSLVYAANQWCRYLLSFLAADVQSELAISDVQFGLLSGYAFAALFVVVSPLSGLILDRIPSPKAPQLMLLFSCVCFSVMTILHGAAKHYWQLVLLRATLAIGEAASTPAAYAVIHSIIRSEHKASAVGIYNSGIYVGGSFASVSVSINARLGWRSTFVLVGIISLVLTGIQALVLLFNVSDAAYEAVLASTEHIDESVNEESRLKPGKTEKPSPWTKLYFINLIASSLRNVGGYALGSFLPSFFKRTYPSHYELYSSLNVIVVGVCGCAASLLGGALADGLSRKYGNLALGLLVTALGAIFATPLMWLCLSGWSFALSIGTLAAAYILAEAWWGPTVKHMQWSAPGSSAAVGVWSASCTVIGNIGPLLTALLEDRASLSLGNSLTITILISYLGCAAVFLALMFASF
jgi:MFS family permease